MIYKINIILNRPMKPLMKVEAELAFEMYGHHFFLHHSVRHNFKLNENKYSISEYCMGVNVVMDYDDRETAIIRAKNDLEYVGKTNFNKELLNKQKQAFELFKIEGNANTIPIAELLTKPFRVGTL